MSSIKVEILKDSDKWVRIYYKVVQGSLKYTIDKKEMRDQIFPEVLQKVVSKNLIGPDNGYYYLKLFTDQDKEVGQLRCQEYQILSQIQTNLDEVKVNLSEIGRPLRIQIHESNHVSILSSNSEHVEFRGLVNLFVLILLTYTLRAIVQSIEKHDFVLFKELDALLKSGTLSDPQNYQTLSAISILFVFAINSYWIEVLATKESVHREIIRVGIFVNALSLLAYPLIVSWTVQSHPLAATYMMVFTAGLVLKLISFHHVMHDNRVLIRKLAATEDIDLNVNQTGLPNDQYQEALRYPKNLNYKRYLIYLVSPTCCYQLKYPHTETMRLGFLFKRLAEIIVFNLFSIYMIYQHMLPIAIESVEPLRNKDYLKILLLTLQMSTSAVYVWLIMFYTMFHSYLNFWAELTYFADRRFYHDWWNAGDLSEYWRKWNFPIHSFLIRHVYYPLRRRKVSKPVALFMTFFISAIAHEYLIVGIFRMVNFIAFTIMIINVPVMVIQHKLKGIVNPNANNISFWLFYLILGQPFGIIFCYYQFNS